METDPQQEFERLYDPVKDRELTIQLLGSLGLYDASQDEYVNPPEPRNEWIIGEVA